MNPPDKIYIKQSQNSEMSWFTEKVLESDVEYIRFDLVRPILIQVAEKWGIDRAGEEKRQIGKEAINLLIKINIGKGPFY